MTSTNTRHNSSTRSQKSFSGLLWLNLGVKVLLIGLLLFGLIRDDLPQFQGKAMEGRALTYPISGLLVPIIWLIVRKRRDHPVSYPHLLDMLLVLPFTIDMAGNALNLYDTIEWWDDLNHLVNWGILSAGFGQLLLRLPVGKLATAGLVVGFGAVTAIIWEIAEYFTFVRNSPEITTAYTDTLGDMALGLTGSVVAAIVTAYLLWPRRPESNLG